MERGLEEPNYDQDQIAAMLADIGVALIVYQPGFWNDLTEMARFEAVLHTGQFERITSFPVMGRHATGEEAIEIYRPTYFVKPGRKHLQIDMPIIRGRFDGSIGK